MRLLYVAPRYHTNQVPIMKGWAENGDAVLFLAQYYGAIESHDYCDLHKMKESWIYKLWKRRIEKKHNASDAETQLLDKFIPSIFDVYHTIENFSPDIIIVRSESIGNAIIVLICKILGKRRIVMYDQAPLYGYRKKIGWKGRIIHSLFPSVVFTPVLYTGNERNKKILDKRPHGYFVPLICNVVKTPKQYVRGGIVRILDIGKFRDYKNHFFLIDALSLIKNKDRFRVTIIGQLRNDDEKDYYKRLSDYVKKKGLNNIVSIKGDVPFNEMEGVYQEHDILVLPSKHETAGMVILEGMAHGLLVMCSSHCGLGCYLEENDCGYIFGLNDANQLKTQLELVLNKPAIIAENGGKAQAVVKDKYSFYNYRKSLNEITKQAFNYSII